MISLFYIIHAWVLPQSHFCFPLGLIMVSVKPNQNKQQTKQKYSCHSYSDLASRLIDVKAPRNISLCTAMAHEGSHIYNEQDFRHDMVIVD